MATQTISSLPLYAATDLSDGVQAFSPLDDLTVVTADKTKRMSWAEQAKWFGGNLPKLTVSTGATGLVASAPFTLSQVWNNNAVSFRGVKIAVTDTASAATSLPLEVLGGAGGVTNLLSARTDGVVQAGTEMRSPVFATRSDSGEYRLGASDDLSLVRVAADHLGVRRGANAQSLSVFGSYTSGSLYNRLRTYYDGSAYYVIAAEHVGDSQKHISVRTGGLDRLKVWSDGEVQVTGIWFRLNDTYLYRVGTDAIGLGGGTNAFPAVYRNGTGIDFKLADNSAFTSTKALNSLLTGYIESDEMTAPAAPAANKVRIYAEDNGAGKTRLMAIFPSGAAQQIVIEP